MTRKKGRIKLFSLPRSPTYSIEAYASGVASPQPVSIYPVALQLMCSRVEPGPPFAPLPSDRPQFQPSFHIYPYRPPLSSPLRLRNPPNSGSLGFASTREYFPFSLSLSSLSLFSFLRSVSRTSSSFFPSSHRSLFVLEIRTGLPNPPFQLRCY